MMNDPTKSAAVGAAFALMIWATTGIWQFFALAAFGTVCTWLFTDPVRARPQPRARRRVIREGVLGQYGAEVACYDYGGCQWAGDGCQRCGRGQGK